MFTDLRLQEEDEQNSIVQVGSLMSDTFILLCDVS